MSSGSIIQWYSGVCL